jgi:predicted acylesterase/phospholipase RssA
MIITRQLSEVAEARDLMADFKVENTGDIVKSRRIGLALSGGGFRAAIFHLGVIRRLEELGIMPQIRAISSVSGGSIIAAYYLCEMERRLHLEPVDLRTDRDVRMRIFEEIAADFLAALDKNLRSRALFYTPFYHPWLFVKTLLMRPFRASARSILIQEEYDRWFYKGNSLDQLPSAPAEDDDARKDVVKGCRLLLNTTSLLSGNRVSFCREPVSGVNEMSRVNTNGLPISRVVGASSGVPGLFPPTLIAGDVLVDGGLTDNQGIESLLEDSTRCNVLLISDASGQMEGENDIGRGIVDVLARVNSVLQFQIRNKLIDNLVGWKHLPDRDHEAHRFAFIHLFLNLKDRPGAEKRVPTEFVPALGRIRTDLDQFSYVEREALMYHGYTLIDAQIRKYCADVFADILTDHPPGEMATPPLFQDSVLNDKSRGAAARDQIRAELEVGSQNLYLLRSVKKYPEVVGPVLAAGALLALLVLALALLVSPQLLYWLGETLADFLFGLIPAAAVSPVDALFARFGLPELSVLVAGVSGIAAFAALFAFLLYLVSFPVYGIVRRYCARRDLKVYQKLTGADASLHWSEP